METLLCAFSAALLLGGFASASGLKVDVSWDKSSAGPNEVVVWSISVANQSVGNATGVEVQISFPSCMLGATRQGLYIPFAEPGRGAAVGFHLLAVEGPTGPFKQRHSGDLATCVPLTNTTS